MYSCLVSLAMLQLHEKIIVVLVGPGLVEKISVDTTHISDSDTSK